MAEWQSAVESVRRTYTARGRLASGYYSIEGIRLHERALHAGIHPVLVLVRELEQARPLKRMEQLLATLQAADVPIIAVPPEVMDDLTNGRSQSDMLGLVSLPPQPPLETLSQPPHPFILVTVDVVDPGNLGALLRTGHAAGITAFVTIGGSDPYHPKAVRTSMGSIFKTPIFSQTNPEVLFTQLQTAGIQTIGAVARQGTPLPQAQFATTGTAVFMGSEYFGLPDVISRQLDSHVTIPMAEGIDSLSINAAAAVILYEIKRRG